MQLAIPPAGIGNLQFELIVKQCSTQVRAANEPQDAVDTVPRTHAQDHIGHRLDHKLQGERYSRGALGCHSA